MPEQVKVPTWLMKLLVSALIALQSWALIEIISLKQSVAGLAARVDDLAGLTPHHVAKK